VTLKYGLEVTQDHSNRYHSKAWVRFPILLDSYHSNYGCILHQFRDKARYWSKIVIFSYPLAFDAPVQGVPIGILPSRFVRKNENGGLPNGVKTLRICNHLDAILACDGRTDGQRDRHLATA